MKQLFIKQGQYKECPKCGEWFNKSSRMSPDSPYVNVYYQYKKDPEQGQYLECQCKRCLFKWNIRCKDEPRKEKEI